MWPFRKKPVSPPPEDVVRGDDRAHFSTVLDCWEFEVDGTEFTLSGRTFDPQAFAWARAALAEMTGLAAEIDQHVLQPLDGWPCEVASRRLLSIGLDDYANAGRIDLAYVGDDSWGDFGVNVILADGKVVEAYGGD
ncbi:MAG: hypothetical protein K9N23_22695 [Akkermansiaceae bacterium]|nr:hypothetical protein [Akkermansiaceae bacterium]MCF7734510.1 hypothetical protein [Akkermansiaceae bacterium]